MRAALAHAQGFAGTLVACVLLAIIAVSIPAWLCTLMTLAVRGVWTLCTWWAQ